MTRKDYERIAKVFAVYLRSTMRPESIRLISDMARDMADMLADDPPIFDRNGNRRFKRDRFLAACGVEEQSSHT